MGTTLCAGLQELNPFLMEWYYRHMSDNDELLAGPSGYQFIYGRDYSEQGYEQWLEKNRAWLESAGFRTGCFWHCSYGTDRFYRYVETAGLEGVFNGDDDVVLDCHEGVVIMNQGDHLVAEGDLYNNLAARQAKLDPSRPHFLNVYPTAATYGYHGIARLKREAERLERDFPGRFVFLLPKDNVATARAYYEQHPRTHSLEKPGDQKLTAHVQNRNRPPAAAAGRRRGNGGEMTRNRHRSAAKAYCNGSIPESVRPGTATPSWAWPPVRGRAARPRKLQQGMGLVFGIPRLRLDLHRIRAPAPQRHGLQRHGRPDLHAHDRNAAGMPRVAGGSGQRLRLPLFAPARDGNPGILPAPSGRLRHRGGADRHRAGRIPPLRISRDAGGAVRSSSTCSTATATTGPRRPFWNRRTTARSGATAIRPDGPNDSASTSPPASPSR